MPIWVTASARFCIKDPKFFQDPFFDPEVAAGNGSGLFRRTCACGRFVFTGVEPRAELMGTQVGLDPICDGCLRSDGRGCGNRHS